MKPSSGFAAAALVCLSPWPSLAQQPAFPFPWAAPLPAPAAQPLAPQPSPVFVPHYVPQPVSRSGLNVKWGQLGFGARFASIYNIPRNRFAIGGGALIRLHPFSYPRSNMPLEIEMEIGYDKYFKEQHDELTYGGTGYLYLSHQRVQPFLLSSLSRSLGDEGKGRDVRWYIGGGFGVGYRTQKFVLALQARGGGLIGGKLTPFHPGTEGLVDVKLVGIFYVF